MSDDPLPLWRILVRVVALAAIPVAAATFVSGHDAVDLKDPRGEAALGWYIASVVFAAIAVAGGIIIAGKHWQGWVVAGTPMAFTLGVTGLLAAGSYATAEHCGGVAAMNAEYMGPFMVLFFVIFLIPLVFVIAGALQPDRRMADEWLTWLTSAASVGFGGALFIAAGWHLVTITSQISTARQAWEDWGVRQAELCAPRYSSTPSLTIVLVVALLVGMTFLMARRRET